MVTAIDAKGTKIPALDIVFDSAIIGYNKNQIVQYISDISTAYQAAYDEYNSILSKCADLKDRGHKKGIDTDGKKEKTKYYVAAKNLMDTVAMAKSIVAGAQSEADHIKAESEALIGEAKSEIARAESERKRLLDSSDGIIDSAREKAKEIIGRVNTDAMQTETCKQSSPVENNIESTYDLIEKTINEIQDILRNSAA
jgi:cell division septum initiation protein DivIVA